jgi:pimeloyl-ACP methyl ester carboxylesterase
VKIQHGRVSLELHALRTKRSKDPEAPRQAPALLLLHALGDSSAGWGVDVQAWPAAVYALDFSGHGRSGWLPGGGYTPEHFAAEADCALAELDAKVCVAGAGLGAYAALLLAGARPDRVSGALLLPGRGLAGAGAWPDFEDSGAMRDPLLRPPGPVQHPPGPASNEATDPLVFSCECDIRPVDYAEEFARRATRLLVSLPAAAYGPAAWLEVAARCAGEAPPAADLGEALRALASQSH